MDSQDCGFISIGGIAVALGVSTTMVRQYERDGRIPRGQRVAGSQARIWPAEEVDEMRSRLAERRAERKEAADAA